MLTKQRHRMEVAYHTHDIVMFRQTPEEEGIPIHYWDLPRKDWRDMGEPKTITITVRPGDLLNDD